MILHSEPAPWERRLIEMARLPTCDTEEEINKHNLQLVLDQNLRAAVAACETITSEHSRSFYLASGLLPAEKRKAMRVLYAFCRTADDLADGDVEQPAVRLYALRQGISGEARVGGDAVLTAWAAIQQCYQIPVCYAEQLLDGVERDLVQRRYASFEELSLYCYSVASTVGLMSMRITGFINHQAVAYAIKLGVALQLTNILRDVGEDWQAGRLYLPLDELAAFGLRESEVAAARVDNRWRTFMHFQITRARRLYAEALPGICLLHPDGQLAVAAAAMLYRGILDDIEAHDYDVFHRRAFVRRGRKLALLLRAWLFVKGINFKHRNQHDLPRVVSEEG